jgi:hypothetical protein
VHIAKDLSQPPSTQAKESIGKVEDIAQNRAWRIFLKEKQLKD